MDIAILLNDKRINSKEKTETLSRWLIGKKLSTDELITFADKTKDSIKATCIEAVEFATKQNPAIANENCLHFVTQALTSKAPRVKWESARVIGNIAPLYPSKLEKTIKNLILNADHDGTVVRWSAAWALGEILKLKTAHNKTLLPTIETLCRKEEKNSIRKIYLAALKHHAG